MRFILIALVILLLSACEINGSSLNKTNQVKQTEPQAPQKSDELTEPQAPQKPEELIEPQAPQKPEELTEPKAPQKPEELTEPQAPQKPEELIEPKAPQKPEELIEPKAPQKPEELTEPQAPQKPEELIEPKAPQKPEELTEPQGPQKPEELTEPKAPQQPDELTESPVPRNQPIPTPAMVYQPSKKQKERLTQQPAVPFEKLPMKQQEKVRESEILPMLAPAKLKHPVSDSLEMMFLIARDDEGDYLYGEGTITPSTYMNFIKVVNKHKERGVDFKRLMMHSPGGTMSSGQKIATYLHSNGWTTDSSKHMRCYSACGFIFASGTKKRMEPGAEIGFHRPYIPDQADTPEFIEATYYRYLDFWIEIGGTRELYDEFMLNYGRDDMLILKSNTINNHFKVEKY